MPPFHRNKILHGSWLYMEDQKSATWKSLAPIMPPIIDQTATDKMESGSKPSFVPQRYVRYTAVATATNVRKPCHDSRKGPKSKRLGFIPIAIVDIMLIS